MKFVTFSLMLLLGLSLPIRAGDEEIDAKIAEKYVQDAIHQKSPLSWKKDALVVPTGEVASQIHSAVAGAIYGKAQIQKEQPFHAIRSGDFWVVFGSLPKGHMGGTAVTVIRASNGQIMRVIHEQ